MPLPLFAAVIAGAAGGVSRLTVTRTVTTAILFSGKTDVGNGYDTGTGAAIATASYGSIDNSALGGATIVCVGQDESLSPDTFEFWVSGTGYSINDIISITVEDSAGSDVLTVDGNTTKSEALGYSGWVWNATDHTLPNWATDVGNARDVTIVYRAGAF